MIGAFAWNSGLYCVWSALQLFLSFSGSLAVIVSVVLMWAYIIFALLYPGDFYAMMVLAPLCVGGITLM